jgi:hypothetical protein
VSWSMLLRRPSAFLPIAMSLAALSTVGIAVGLLGLGRQADEGAPAHLWQLLMAAQLPIIAFFAVRWLPRARAQALLVLVLQVVAAVAALLPVYLLGL